MATYNGHSSWAAWNVSLHINNDEGLYNLAKDAIRYTKSRADAAASMLNTLQEFGMEKTPDGAKYTITSIQKAMVGL